MVDENIRIEVLKGNDIDKILKELNEPYIMERHEYYKEFFGTCLRGNENKEMITFIAYVDNKVAGYVNLNFKSSYNYFEKNSIPEIKDLYVLPKYRKKGIGKMLIRRCESHALVNYKNIGLGIGLYKDYGRAQNLFSKMGYILDGSGLIFKNSQITSGNYVFVDDNLLLYLYKKIG